MFIEKTNQDTFLKVFDQNLIINDVKPKDNNILHSGLTVNLNHENFSFDSGLSVYENLGKKNNDKYWWKCAELLQNQMPQKIKTWC